MIKSDLKILNQICAFDKGLSFFKAAPINIFVLTMDEITIKWVSLSETERKLLLDSAVPIALLSISLLLSMSFISSLLCFGMVFIILV